MCTMARVGDSMRFGLPGLPDRDGQQHATDEAASVPLEPAVIQEQDTASYPGEPNGC